MTSDSFSRWLFRLVFALPVCLMSADAPAQTSGPEQKVADRSADAPKILVLGDSIAAGYGLEPDEGFPALLQNRIDDRGWNFRIVNAGSSGDTSSGGLRRIDWLLRQKIDVLLLELGGNDGLRGIPPETTRTNLQAIIDRTKAKYPSVHIVILGMKMPPNMGADYTARFENIFPELASRNQALLVPFLLEGVGGRPDLNLPDRIHPTSAGHKILAENVWKILGPLLEKIALAAESTSQKTPADAPAEIPSFGTRAR